MLKSFLSDGLGFHNLLSFLGVREVNDSHRSNSVDFFDQGKHFSSSAVKGSSFNIQRNIPMRFLYFFKVVCGCFFISSDVTRYVHITSAQDFSS